MLLDNWEIVEEIKRYIETNDNENMMTQNLWDAANAFLRGKFIAIQSYLKKWENSQPNLIPKATGERTSSKMLS